jgi:ribosomal protein S27AE
MRKLKVGLLDAKCPKCDNRAQVDDDAKRVECKKCGYIDNYENYIETMKSKAENMADNYQFKGNL